MNAAANDEALFSAKEEEWFDLTLQLAFDLSRKYCPTTTEKLLAAPESLNRAGTFSRHIRALIGVQDALILWGPKVTEKQSRRYCEKWELPMPCRRVFYKTRKELLAQDRLYWAILSELWGCDASEVLPFFHKPKEKDHDEEKADRPASGRQRRPRNH